MRRGDVNLDCHLVWLHPRLLVFLNAMAFGRLSLTSVFRIAVLLSDPHPGFRGSCGDVTPYLPVHSTCENIVRVGIDVTALWRELGTSCHLREN